MRKFEIILIIIMVCIITYILVDTYIFSKKPYEEALYIVFPEEHSEIINKKESVENFLQDAKEQRLEFEKSMKELNEYVEGGNHNE